MSYRPIEEMDVYLTAREIARFVYSRASRWPEFDRRVLSAQICRSADSIGANLVEGEGRGSAQDGLRFLYYARASARETRHWLSVASERELLDPEEHARAEALVLQVARQINGLIRSRRDSGQVREDVPSYGASDPFEEEA